MCTLYFLFIHLGAFELKGIDAGFRLTAAVLVVAFRGSPESTTAPPYSYITLTCPVMSSGPSNVWVNISRCHFSGTISVAGGQQKKSIGTALTISWLDVLANIWLKRRSVSCLDGFTLLNRIACAPQQTLHLKDHTACGTRIHTYSYSALNVVLGYSTAGEAACYLGGATCTEAATVDEKCKKKYTPIHYTKNNRWTRIYALFRAASMSVRTSGSACNRHPKMKTTKNSIDAVQRYLEAKRRT